MLQPVYPRFRFRGFRADVIFALLLLFTDPFACLSTELDGKRPNVVLFVIDDLGYTDLGCYGSEFYQTPNIDRLAKNGCVFTNFYSASPVCSPTRVALMTGKYPQRLGITQWIPQPSNKHLSHDEITIGEAFEQNGYRTGYIGKWHLGEKLNQLPDHHGFSWIRSVNRAGQPGSYFFPFKGNEKKGKRYHDVPDLDQAPSGSYLTDLNTDQALAFISEPVADKPFFLCVSYYAVHTPIQAPKELTDKYVEHRNRQFQEDSLPLEEQFGAKVRSRQDMPAYAAMIENLDTNIGRVMERLQSNHLAKDTLILFTSDNGGLSTLSQRPGPTSCLPLRAGKGWTYEGGIRVPTLVHWPGKVPQSKLLTPGISMDIYPTLLELAGLPAQTQQHIDGRSLAPKILGSGDEKLDPRILAWHYPHRHGSGHRPSNAIRQGKWKLVVRKDAAELFDLDADVGERKNVAETNPKIVSDLQAKLTHWMKETQPE